tara:strand:- start:190 stop:477 length:288 start_codon:yes stop_codon:yes gene_type:complete
MNISQLPQITFLAFMLIILSACGSDYVSQKYFGIPYGGTRTAGAGIEYVRANLAAKKGLAVEPSAPTLPNTVTEKYFKKFQSKMHTFKLEYRYNH